MVTKVHPTDRTVTMAMTSPYTMCVLVFLKVKSYKVIKITEEVFINVSKYLEMFIQDKGHKLVIPSSGASGHAETDFP